jgi:hypothetical protein
VVELAQVAVNQQVLVARLKDNLISGQLFTFFIKNRSLKRERFFFVLTAKSAEVRKDYWKMKYKILFAAPLRRCEKNFSLFYR